MVERKHIHIVRTTLRAAGWGLLVFTAVIILLPNLLPVEQYRLLGSPYFRPQDDFLTRLLQATGQSFWMAVLGTVVVLTGSLSLGLAQGGRSGRTLDIPLLFTIGAVAVPDLALLIALRKAWPSVPVPLSPAVTAFTVRAVVGLVCVLVAWRLVASARNAQRGLAVLCCLAGVAVVSSPASAFVAVIESTLPTLLERPSTATYDLVRNMSVVLLLSVLAMPIPARLIASRVRSLKGQLFVKASRAVGAPSSLTFRREILPHLAEDIAWIAALTFPRFVHIEVGLFFLGLGYSEFHGLGELLEDSRIGQAQLGGLIRLGATIGMIVWISLLPQVVLRLAGARPHTMEKAP